MKQIIITMAIILFFIQNGFAQKIYVAPVIGGNANFANLSKAAKDYYKSINWTDEDAEVTVTSKFPPAVGFQLGGLVSYSMKAIALQSGILVTNKAFSIKRNGYGKDPSGKESSISWKSTISIFYLDIPLWASYKIGESGFKVTAGPTFGFAVGGKSRAKINEMGNSTKESDKLSIGSTPYTDDVKPVDISVNLSVGKEIELGEEVLDISLFAQPSISKWNPASKVAKDFGVGHFTTGVRMAYYIPIK